MTASSRTRCDEAFRQVSSWKTHIFHGNQSHRVLISGRGFLGLSQNGVSAHDKNRSPVPFHQASSVGGIIWRWHTMCEYCVTWNLNEGSALGTHHVLH